MFFTIIGVTMPKQVSSAVKKKKKRENLFIELQIGALNKSFSEQVVLTLTTIIDGKI
jgi:hypothetical protein